jgi:urease subunit gamma
MIHVKAVVKGEPDTLPFTMLFQYPDISDELVFYNSVKMIREKLAKNLKINTNESLVFYCAYVVSAVRAHESVSKIESNGSKILSDKKVMIGVPETLSKITFEATIDNFSKKQISFDNPILITAPRINLH